MLKKHLAGFTLLETLFVEMPGNYYNNQRKTKKLLTGFTLIELLVVVAIIGLLLSVISISLTQARSRSRDTKRISDMKQIKTGFDLYYNTGYGYPDNAAWLVGTPLSCSGTAIMQIPKDPGSPVYDYTYNASGTSSSGCAATVRSGYTVRFYMENKGGYYTMDEEGIVRDASNNVVGFDQLL